MNLPQSIRKFSCNSTVVPFATNVDQGLIAKDARCKPAERPSWLVHFSNHWSENCKKLSVRKPQKIKVLKLAVKPRWELSKSFFQAKKEIEKEILNFFSFNTEIPVKMNLIKKFNIKFISGEITTIEQMIAFLKKTEELANCIKVYLLKNEYSENFMREISFDVFENGFKPKTQEDIKSNYPNYFVSNN